MTESPDWGEGPFPGVHPDATQLTQFTRPFTQQQLLEIGAELVEQFLRRVLLALAGSFIPGSTSFDQLVAWASDIPILGDIVEALTGQVGGLELLSPLSWLFPAFTDNGDGTVSMVLDELTEFSDGIWTFAADGVHTVIDNGDGTLMSPSGLFESLVSSVGTYQALVAQQQSVIDQIFNAINATALTGVPTSWVQNAVQNIPFVNVLGLGGPTNLGLSLQSTWDNLISGLLGVSGTGTGLSDLFNIAQEISSRATLGLFSWDILGIRTNKPFWSGLLPTSTSTFPLTQVAAGAAAPTVSVTASVARTGFHRFAESMSLGVVSWLGGGNTSITDMRVNLWQVDPVSGDETLVHASANIIGDVSGTTGWNTYELPDPLAVEASDVLGAEIEVRTGAGTHSLVAQATWLPDHPTVHPKRMAATRNPGGAAPPDTIDSGDVTYTGDVPWIEFGISTGATGDAHEPTLTQLTAVGTYTTPIPSWADFLDVVCLGGGGGGHSGGSWPIYGEGGDAGDWASDTWERGVDFDDAVTTVSITIGAAASGGTSAIGDNNGHTGADAVASITGHTVTGGGGTGGNQFFGTASGDAAGNLTYNDVIYYGGGTQNSYGADGTPYGGGGGGGSYVNYQPGGDGARGTVWIRAYQTPSGS